MSANQISVSIPDDVITQVNTALNQVKTLLQPYLQSLKDDEKHDLPKMKEKTFSFVSKTDSYCASNPEFIPTFLNAAELDKDFKVVNALKPVLDVVNQLQSNIDDTVVLAGSEAYIASLLYYANVQMFAKAGQPNAKPIFEDLQQRFARTSKKTPGTTESNKAQSK